MNYIEFKKELKELMKKELGRDVQITFEVAEKNNGKSEESIVFYKQKEYSQIQSTRRYQHPQLMRMLADMEKLENAFEEVKKASND